MCDDITATSRPAEVAPGVDCSRDAGRRWRLVADGIEAQLAPRPLAGPLLSVDAGYRRTMAKGRMGHAAMSLRAVSAGVASATTTTSGVSAGTF